MVDKVLTVCPYCGAGCMLNLLVENGTIVGAEPAPGRTNQSELCLKGYYGWDFLNDYEAPDAATETAADAPQSRAKISGSIVGRSH